MGHAALLISAVEVGNKQLVSAVILLWRWKVSNTALTMLSCVTYLFLYPVFTDTALLASVRLFGNRECCVNAVSSTVGYFTAGLSVSWLLERYLF
jgi:hypothetical protein